jgi:large subunit ribosomal protein L29
MDGREIRAMTEEDLALALDGARQELFNLRFQKATGRLSDTSRSRQVRRDIARLLTVQRERQLWAAYEAYLEDAQGEE